MANNRIEIFQNNTRSIGCVVYGGLDLTDFTPWLTIKKRSSDVDALLSIEGYVTDPSTTVMFDLTPTDTSLAVGDYVYDVTIDDGTEVYTVVRDRFSILDAVRT